MNLDEALESGRVMRYHAAPIDKKQSVAEHTWGVMVILHKLCNPSPELLTHALFHDVAELHTGDVPAPVKKSSQLVKDTFDALETRALHTMGITLPHLTDGEKRYLKIADCLEGMMYCESRIKAGDLNAIDVRDRYVTYLAGLDFNIGDIDVSQ